MKLTRSLLLIAGIALGGFTACNYTVGECYPRGQGSDNAGAVAGAGGSIVNPPGVGGFGDAPPKQPQDTTNPPPQFDCNSHDTATPAPSPASIDFVHFNPSEFPFVTTIQDDGEGKGGGWQEARASLGFVHITVPHTSDAWYCSFTIGMPLRSEVWGVVPARRAANISVDVTEAAGRGMNYKLSPTEFCEAFIKSAIAEFDSQYPKLGARVTK